MRTCACTCDARVTCTCTCACVHVHVCSSSYSYACCAAAAAALAAAARRASSARATGVIARAVARSIWREASLSSATALRPGTPPDWAAGHPCCRDGGSAAAARSRRARRAIAARHLCMVRRCETTGPSNQFIRCTCSAHAAHMPCTCSAHAEHMQRTCRAHAAHMPYTCSACTCATADQSKKSHEAKPVCVAIVALL